MMSHGRHFPTDPYFCKREKEQERLERIGFDDGFTDEALIRWCETTAAKIDALADAVGVRLLVDHRGRVRYIYGGDDHGRF